MTINMTSQNMIIDETAGLQDDDVASSALQSVSAAVDSHLINDNDFPRSTAGAIITPEFAYQSDFIVFTLSGGSSITDMTLTQHASGAPFSTTLGVNSGVATVEGETIWLFADATNANTLLGRTGVDVTAAAIEPLPS